MKLNTFLATILALALGAMHALAQGTAFDYQGRLTDNGIPATGLYDFQFTLFAVSSGGSPIGSPNIPAPVPVTNGLFNVTLNFGSGTFAGADRWLQIAVRTNGDASPHILLTPRQPLLPVPYAIHAASAGAFAATADLTAARLNVGVGNSITGTGTTIAGGSNNRILAAADYSAISGGRFNTIETNSIYSTIGGGRFSTIRSNAQYGTIGGGYLHEIGSNTWYATISGGYSNTNGPGAHYSSIGGGIWNAVQRAQAATIGGGIENAIAPEAHYAAIGGGIRNVVGTNSSYASVGGGWENLIAQDATATAIAGGWRNSISNSAHYSAIAGGRSNVVGAGTWYGTVGGGLMNGIGPNAYYATVPGGLRNQADGQLSLAAGYRAKASHYGAFVWADGTEADFASTGGNQFLIRASGGVGIGTANPQSALEVNGIISASAIRVANSTLVANLNADQLDGLNSGDFWKLNGNTGTTPGTHFLGTTDNQALELKVNGQRVLRLEPDPDSPNFIAGYGANVVSSGVSGATIGGGGAPGMLNMIASDFGTIGGGAGNSLISQVPIGNSFPFGTIAGGQSNVVFRGSYATIGGGANNKITKPDSHVENFYSTIAGGFGNAVHSHESGCGAIIPPNFFNEPDMGCTIGGGLWNLIGAEDGLCFPLSYSTIAGGVGNWIFGDYTTISGGGFNEAEINSTVGGGTNNTALRDATVAGGTDNYASYGASIGGGRDNRAAGYSSVAGGQGNVANANHSSIGGGSNNTLSANFGTIGGGARNSGHRPFVTIGGGEGNEGWSRHAVIGGGQSNIVDLSSGATIGGGVGNRIWTELGAFVPGSFDSFGVIGGGRGNVCEAIPGGVVGMTISGGTSNKISAPHATISGGQQNSISLSSWPDGGGVIGGGQSNRIDGAWATVPGGVGNLAAGDHSFAAGRRAKANHDGSFVWADSANADFASTRSNQFSIRAAGGVVHCSGTFSGGGEAESASYTLRVTTTGEGIGEMFLDGDAGTQRLIVPVNRTWSFHALVSGRSAAGESVGFEIKGVIKNIGGTTTLVPTTPTGWPPGPQSIQGTAFARDLLCADVSAEADNTNDALVIKVGPGLLCGPLPTIRWVANIRTVSVGF